MVPALAKKSVSGGCVVDKTRRGKGAKIMAAADAVGFPPALHVASASPHEATLQMKERVLYRVPRALQGSLSQLRCSLRFFFEGMTASIPCFSARARILSVSRPLSAKSLSAANPSIGAIARAQSAVAPRVTKALTGMPCASAAGCDFVLSPLLRGSSPGCRQPLQQHGDAPCNGSRQSSATHGQAQP